MSLNEVTDAIRERARTALGYDPAQALGGEAIETIHDAATHVVGRLDHWACRDMLANELTARIARIKEDGDDDDPS